MLENTITTAPISSNDNTALAPSDEEKKGLLAELLQKIRDFFEKAKHILPSASAYEAMKKCEKTVKELGETTELNYDAVSEVYGMVSELALKIDSLDEHTLRKSFTDVIDRLEAIKREVPKYTIGVNVGKDFTKALEAEFSDLDLEKATKEILITADEKDIVVKVGNEYALAELLSPRNSTEYDTVKLVPISSDYIEPDKLKPVEAKEGDTLEDTFLRALANRNELQYQKDIEARETELTKIENRGNAVNLLKDVVQFCDERHRPYVIPKDINRECYYSSTDNSFRVRDRKTERMLVFSINEGNLSVSATKSNDSTVPLDKLVLAPVGSWEQADNSYKGQLSMYSDEKELLASEYSKAILAHVAGVSNESLDNMAKEVENTKSKLGMDKDNKPSNRDKSDYADNDNKADKLLINELAEQSANNELFKDGGIKFEQLNNGNIKAVLDNKKTFFINLDKNGDFKNISGRNKAGKNVAIFDGTMKEEGMEFANDKEFNALRKITTNSIKAVNTKDNKQVPETAKTEKPAQKPKQTPAQKSEQKPTQKSEQKPAPTPPVDKFEKSYNMEVANWINTAVTSAFEKNEKLTAPFIASECNISYAKASMSVVETLKDWGICDKGTNELTMNMEQYKAFLESNQDKPIAKYALDELNKAEKQKPERENTDEHTPSAERTNDDKSKSKPKKGKDIDKD